MFVLWWVSKVSPLCSVVVEILSFASSLLVKRSLPQGWRIGGLRHVDMGCTIIFLWRLCDHGASPSPRLLEAQSLHVGVCSV